MDLQGFVTCLAVAEWMGFGLYICKHTSKLFCKSSIFFFLSFDEVCSKLYSFLNIHRLFSLFLFKYKLKYIHQNIFDERFHQELSSVPSKSLHSTNSQVISYQK